MQQTTIVVDNFFVESLSPTLDYIKDKDADAKIRVSTPYDSSTAKTEIILRYKEMNISVEVLHGVSQFQTLAPQPYEIIKLDSDEVIGNVNIKQDGVYDIILSTGRNVTSFPLTAPTNIHVLWSIPQYLIMTIGEVLFSVCGLDFAYTEAPRAMKSVMSAANLLTVTVGLWLYALLTAISSSSGLFEYTPSREAFTYSALMLIDTMIFFILVKRYNNLKEQVDATTPPEKPSDKETTGHENPAYEEEDPV